MKVVHLALLASVLALATDAAAQVRRWEPNPPPGPMQPSRPPSLPGLIVPGKGVPGANCRTVCANQCSTVSCEGLSQGKCRSTRQACRVACSSQC